MNGNKKYVAFLDILGFKSTLKKLGQKKGIEYIQEYSRVVYIIFSQLKQKKSFSEINGFIVSDSIVLYTNDTGEKTLDKFIQIILKLCREEFIENGILLRGAIAKGAFSKIPAIELSNLQKQLIIGDAYVEAYSMENSFKSIGVRLSEEVYQDVVNIDLTKDIVEETVNKDIYYVLRYMSIDYLLDTKYILEKFVSSAEESAWLPHYYNALCFAMKKVSNDKKIDELFSCIIKIIEKGKASENWRNVDTFIKNSFDEDVFFDYKKRFLKYLRKRISASNSLI